MGWRSIAADILKHPDIPKIKPTSLFIGPHIRRENYEVSAEFTQHFPNSDNFHHENDKITFDLAGEVKARALSLWPSVAIEESHTCTFDHDELHSVRKEPTKQRNWNLYLPQGWSYDTK
jgi:copper oxidase (laccase) domain-containing protein